ncbi:MAG: hypothetical protein ACJAVI_005832 [Candidatus Azotimanducaceae bacterium]|jgi:hypothetical protein
MYGTPMKQLALFTLTTLMRLLVRRLISEQEKVKGMSNKIDDEMTERVTLEMALEEANLFGRSWQEGRSG